MHRTLLVLFLVVAPAACRPRAENLGDRSTTNLDLLLLAPDANPESRVLVTYLQDRTAHGMPLSDVVLCDSSAVRMVSADVEKYLVTFGAALSVLLDSTCTAQPAGLMESGDHFTTPQLFIEHLTIIGDSAEVRTLIRIDQEISHRETATLERVDGWTTTRIVSDLKGRGPED